MHKKAAKIIALATGIFIALTLTAQRRANFIELGRIELSSGHYAKAIENFNIGLKLNPDNYEAYYLRAFAKFQLDDYTGTEEDCTHSIELNPRQADVYCYRAIARNSLFDYNGALEDYQKAIETDSSHAEIYINRAITYLSLQQYELAVADCNHAQQMHSHDENLYLIRATCESKLNLYNEAIADFNIAIDMKPNNARAYTQRGMARAAAGDKDSAMIDFNTTLKKDSLNGLAMFQKALLEEQEEHDDTALIYLNLVIQWSPLSASAWFQRALIESKKKDYYKALNDFNKVLSLAPDHIRTFYNRAGLQLEHGDLQGALADYNKVLALYPQFTDAYKNRAEVKKAMGDVKGAAADIKYANEMQQIQTSASDSTKYYEGLKLMKLIAFSDDFETPKNDKNKVQYRNDDIQLQPLFSVVLFASPGSKMRVYGTGIKQRYGGADLTIFSKNDSVDGVLMKKKFEQLDTLITRSPAQANLYAERGVIFNYLQVYDQALSDFDKAIDLDPINALFYFDRANTRVNLMELERLDNPEAKSKLKDFSPDVLQENSYDLAISDYSRALKLDSTFSYAWYNRASAKIALNDFEGALNDLTQSIQCDSTLGEACFNQGLLLIMMHENDDACIRLSKAGELGVLESYAVIKRYCDK